MCEQDLNGQYPSFDGEDMMPVEQDQPSAIRNSAVFAFDDITLSFDEGGWLINTRKGELTGRAKTIHEAKADGFEAFASILRERRDQAEAALIEVLWEENPEQKE